MNTTEEEATLSTADLVAAAETPVARREPTPVSPEPVIDSKESTVSDEKEQLAPLFLASSAEDFRARWDAVQISFVDDPKQAVRKADELVAQVMKNLAETFSAERAKIDAQFNETGDAATENLRVALRRYRSFFQRLLSL
ncbi:MAG: hypothetical protein ABI330_15425 [Caldimonas sp.]